MRKDRMPYRMLCNDVKREGAKPSPDLVSGLFCFLPLHNIRYGIGLFSHSPLIPEISKGFNV